MNDHKLHDDGLCWGTWLASGSPIITEMAATCGADWILLDMEHGYLTESEVLPNLMAAKGSAAAVIVRVPSHDPSLIGRLLDRGAQGIMVPHVNSEEEARQLVAAFRYPPDGIRGYSRSTRAHAYGVNQKAVNDKPVFFAQIESLQGVKNASAIASVDGVDVLFVGPADLRQDLSSHPSAMTYEEAVSQVVSTCRTHHKRAGIFLRDRQEAQSMASAGFSRIAVDSDLGILRAAFTAQGSFSIL